MLADHFGLPPEATTCRSIGEAFGAPIFTWQNRVQRVSCPTEWPGIWLVSRFGMKLNAHGTVTFYPQDQVHSPKSISHLLTDTHQWPTQRSWLPKCRCVSKCLKHNYNLPFFHSKSLSLLFPKCSTYILKRKEKPEFCRSSVHRLGHAASSYWSWFTQATGALQYELFKLWWFWEVERVERYRKSRKVCNKSNLKFVIRVFSLGASEF